MKYKGLIALGAIDLGLVGLGTYTFTLAQNSLYKTDVTESEFDKSYLTKTKALPTDGSKPSDWSILDNLQYASYYLDINRNWKATTTGEVTTNAGVNVTQGVKNVRIVENDYMFQEAISYSSMVKIASQKFYHNNKAFIRNGSAASLDDATFGDSVSAVSYDYIYQKFGFLPNQLNSYYYGENSVLPSSYIETTDDGNYILHVDLDTEYGPINSRREVVTNGGAEDYPTYSIVHADITITPEWKTLQIDTHDCYVLKKNIGLGIIDANCDSKLTEVFEYDQTIDPTIVSFFSSHFNDYVDDNNVQENKEKSALDYLQNMANLLTNDTILDVQLNGDKNTLDGQLELNLANRGLVQLTLEDKYFVRYYNDKVKASLNGLNLSLDEEFITYLIASFPQEEEGASLDTASFDFNEYLGEDFDFNELTSQLMDSFVLSYIDNYAVVNLGVDYKGIGLDGKITFDKESMDLISIDAVASYNETSLTIGVDTSDTFNAEKFNSLNYHSLNNAKWMIDSIKDIVGYEGYELDASYTYKNLDFNVQGLVTKEGDIDADITFARKEQPNKTKRISFIKKGEKCFIGYGNLKVQATQTNLLKIIQEFASIYENSADSINISASDILSGIDHAFEMVDTLEVDENGKITLSVTDDNNVNYTVTADRDNNGNLTAALKDPAVSFVVKEFLGEVTLNTDSSVLSEDELSEVANLALDLRDSLNSKTLSSELEFNIHNDAITTNILANVQFDGDKYLIQLKADQDLDLTVTVYGDGEYAYVSCTYDFVDLNFKLENSDAVEFYNNLYSILNQYYGEELTTKIDEITGMIKNSNNEVTLESFADFVYTLIDSNFEYDVSVNTELNGLITFDYQGEYGNGQVSFLENRETSDFVITGKMNDVLSSSITINHDTFDYVLDESIYFTPINNVQNATWAVEAVNEIASFKGYQLNGNVSYEDINFDVNVIIDSNNDIKANLEISYEDYKHNLIITKNGDNYYLELGNIKLTCTQDKLNEYLEKVITLASKQEGLSEEETKKLVDSSLEVIKSHSLLVESLTFDKTNPQFVTTIKLDDSYYLLSLGGENGNYELSCSSDSKYLLSLTLKENINEVSVNEGNYLTCEDIETLISYFENYYESVKDNIFTSSFNASLCFDGINVNLEGTLYASEDRYYLPLDIKINDYLVNVNIHVLEDGSYVDFTYEGLTYGFKVSSTDIKDIVSEVTAYITELVSSSDSKEIKVNYDEIMSTIKNILSTSYENEVNITKVNDSFVFSYQDNEITLSSSTLKGNVLGNNFEVTLSSENSLTSYALDPAISYTSISGLTNINGYLDYYKDIASYEGYKLSGQIVYKDYTLNSETLIDSNNNVSLVLSVAYENNEHQIYVDYIDNKAYITFGSVNISCSKDKAISYVEEIMASMPASELSEEEKNEYVNLVKKLLKEHQDFLTSIEFAATGIKLDLNLDNNSYVLNLAKEENGYSLSSSGLDYSATLTLTENKEAVLVRSADYFNEEEIDVVVKYIKEIYNEVKDSNVTGTFALTGNVVNKEANILGTYAKEDNKIKVTLEVKVEDIIVSGRIDINETTSYLLVSYEDIDYGFQFDTTDFVTIVENYKEVYKKLTGEELEINATTDIDVIEYINKFLKGTYENDAVLSYDNGTLKVGYQDYVGSLSKNINNDYVLSTEVEGYKVEVTIGKEDVDYSIDTRVTYALVDGIDKALDYIEYYKEIASYSGYLVKGTATYQDYTFEIEAKVDNENNVSTVLSVTYENNEHQIYVDYIDNKAYITFGSVNISCSKDKAMSYVEELMTVLPTTEISEEQKKEYITKVKEFLSSHEDFIKSVTLDTTNINLQVNYEDRVYNMDLSKEETGYKLTSIGTEYNVSLTLTENKEAVLVRSADYFNEEEIDEVIEYLKTIYSEVEDKVFTTKYEVNGTINDENCLVSGAVSMNNSNIKVTLDVAYGSEVVSGRIDINDEKSYLTIYYDGYKYGLEFTNTDFVTLIDNYKEVYKKVTGNELEFNSSELDIVSYLNTFLKGTYENDVVLDFTGSTLKIGYSGYEVTLTKNLNNEYVLSLSALGYKGDITLGNYDVDYTLDNTLTYCVVNGLANALDYIDYVKEIIDYEGFYMSGSIDYKSLTLSYDALIDSNYAVNANIVLSNVNEQIKINTQYYDNYVYLTVGNISVKCTIADLMDTAEKVLKLFDIELKGFNLKDTLEIIQKFDLSVISTTMKSTSLSVALVEALNTYNGTLSYVDNKISLSIAEFDTFTLDVVESKEKVNLDLTKTYLSYDDIKEVYSWGEKVYDLYTNKTLGLDINVVDSSATYFTSITGKVFYAGLDKMEADIVMSGDYNVTLNIVKIDEKVYVKAVYDNYELDFSFTYDSFNETVLKSISILNEAYSLGIDESLLDTSSLTSSFELDEDTIVKYINQVLDGDYVSKAYVTFDNNVLTLTYDNYSVKVNEDIDGNVNLTTSIEGYDVSVVVKEDASEIALDNTKYIDISVEEEFSYLTKMIVDVMKYQGYEAMLDFSYDEVIYHVELEMDSTYAVYAYITITVDSKEHDISLYYKDETISLIYGGIKVQLNQNEISSLISSINALLGTTSEQASEVEQGMLLISDYVNFLKFKEGQVINPSINLLGSTYSFSLQTSQVNGVYNFSVPDINLTGTLSEYVGTVVVSDEKYLTKSDLDYIIDTAEEVRDIIDTKKIYVNLDFDIVSNGTKYKFDGEVKFDLTNSSNMMFDVDATITDVTNSKTIMFGKIHFQDDNFYVGATFDSLYTFNVGFARKDAMKAINVLLKKLENSPFADGNYVLDENVMQTIYDLLVKIDSSSEYTDPFGSIDTTVPNSLAGIMATIKSVVTLDLDNLLSLSMNEKVINVQYDNLVNFNITHNSSSQLTAEGSGNYDGMTYNGNVTVLDYVAPSFNASDFTFMTDLTELATAAMNTINARKYDGYATATMKLVSLFDVNLTINNILIELDDKANPLGYVKLTAPRVFNLTEDYSVGLANGVRTDITSYIYFSKEGPVYLRRSYKYGTVFSSKTRTEYLSYASLDEFTANFLDAFIWLCKFDKSALTDLLNQSSSKEEANMVKSYAVSNNGNTYTLGVDTSPVTTALKDVNLVLTTSDHDSESNYLKAVSGSLTVFSSTLLTIKFNGQLNSFGQDLDYSSMPTSSEMKG